jgi:hypothetical protein
MAITGTVQVTGRIAPTSELDTYAVTDPQYGLGGLRSVATTSARNAITMKRRERGMVVYVEDVNTYYTLIGGTADANWTVFTGSTGAGGEQLLIIGSVDTSIDPILMKGKTASSLSGETISLSYVGGVTPLTGGVYLTNPSQGTGFPVYFPTGAMDSIAFTTQTLTAGIGNSVTLRLVVTGSSNSASHDIEIFMGNSIRWGVSSLESLTAGNMRTQLTQSMVSSQAANALPHTIGVTAMYGEYVYYAYPARFGEVKQSINNGAYGGMYLQGNFGVPGEVSVMYSNELEYMESFYITRSRNPHLGSSLEVKTVSI